MDDLDSILADVWQRLFASAGNPRAPFGLGTLATVDAKGAPRQRIMVLRGVDPVHRQLHCYTDSRAPKTSDLRKDPRVSWLCYDTAARTQVILGGTAEVHDYGELAEKGWRLVNRASQKNYTSRLIPGSPVDADTREREELLGRLPLVPESRRTVRQFAVITLTVEQIDWLQLLPHGDRRAQFTWTPCGWRKTWVIP